MKSLIKISSIRSSEDIGNIRRGISNLQGIIACYIKKEKSEVSIVYDNHFVNINNIYNILEDMGYTVLSK